MKQIVAIFCLMLTSLTVVAAKRTEAQMYAEIKIRVINIMAQHSHLHESQITEDKRLVDDLKLSPEVLQTVRDELAFEIGESISDKSFAQITTVQRAINYLLVKQQSM